MPSPFLCSMVGKPSEFYCSLCKRNFLSGNLKQSIAAEGKAALLKEWDEHLYSTHRRRES